LSLIRHRPSLPQLTPSWRAALLAMGRRVSPRAVLLGCGEPMGWSAFGDRAELEPELARELVATALDALTDPDRSDEAQPSEGPPKTKAEPKERTVLAQLLCLQAAYLAHGGTMAEAEDRLRTVRAMVATPEGVEPPEQSAGRWAYHRARLLWFLAGDRREEAERQSRDLLEAAKQRPSTDPADTAQADEEAEEADQPAQPATPTAWIKPVGPTQERRWIVGCWLDALEQGLRQRAEPQGLRDTLQTTRTLIEGLEDAEPDTLQRLEQRLEQLGERINQPADSQ
jgi:hypothetical protein